MYNFYCINAYLFCIIYVDFDTSQNMFNIARDFGATVCNSDAYFELMVDHITDHRCPVDWEHIRKVCTHV